MGCFVANCCADCGARVLELDPDCADALLGLAIIKFGSKDTQEVREICAVHRCCRPCCPVSSQAVAVRIPFADGLSNLPSPL